MDVNAKITALVPILIALLSMMKSAGFPTKYIPLCAILAGLLFGFMIEGNDIVQAVITGCGIGLSSIGLHSGIKNTLNK